MGDICLLSQSSLSVLVVKFNWLTGWHIPSQSLALVLAALLIYVEKVHTAWYLKLDEWTFYFKMIIIEIGNDVFFAGLLRRDIGEICVVTDILTNRFNFSIFWFKQKCFNRNMGSETSCPWNYDKLTVLSTNCLTNQMTDQWTDQVIGKFHLQQLTYIPKLCLSCVKTK